MTTYKYKYLNDEAVIEVKGHTGFAESGSDIVCASISTACIMTANLIDKLNPGYNIKDLKNDEGYFRLEVKLADSSVKAAFDNLVETLDSLQEQYPEYIRNKN